MKRGGNLQTRGSRCVVLVGAGDRRMSSCTLVCVAPTQPQSTKGSPPPSRLHRTLHTQQHSDLRSLQALTYTSYAAHHNTSYAAHRHPSFSLPVCLHASISQSEQASLALCLGLLLRLHLPRKLLQVEPFGKGGLVAGQVGVIQQGLLVGWLVDWLMSV